MAPARLGRLFHGMLTIGLCIFVPVPFGWMVSTSLKPIADTHAYPHLTFDGLTGWAAPMQACLVWGSTDR